MKVRTGFVSNSSSSSFVIYGIFFEGREDVYNRLKPEIRDKNATEDDMCFCSLFENGIGYEGGQECGRYFGISHTQMGLDETRREFEARVKTLLSEVFIDVKSEELSVHEECFYEG